MDTSDATPPSMTPPTDLGEPPDVPSRWPMVFGVIGIIIASFGLLGACCGMVMPLAWPAYVDLIAKFLPDEKIVEAMRHMRPPIAWTLLSSVLGLATAILLLTGSIKLIRRNASGVSMCKLWAWIIIPWTLIAIPVSMMIQPQMPPDLQRGGLNMQVGAGMGACFGVVWGLTFPIVMLIWFARRAVKDEVRGWEGEIREVI